MKTKESILITAKNHNLIKIFTIFLIFGVIKYFNSIIILFYKSDFDLPIQKETS